MELKEYITTELSLLMNRVQNESCKAQLTNLQTTLLEQLDSQQHDLKEIIADLENYLPGLKKKPKIPEKNTEKSEKKSEKNPEKNRQSVS